MFLNFRTSFDVISVSGSSLYRLYYHASTHKPEVIRVPLRRLTFHYIVCLAYKQTRKLQFADVKCTTGLKCQRHQLRLSPDAVRVDIQVEQR